jgi:hypothetical protein
MVHRALLKSWAPFSWLLHTTILPQKGEKKLSVKNNDLERNGSWAPLWQTFWQQNICYTIHRSLWEFHCCAVQNFFAVESCKKCWCTAQLGSISCLQGVEHNSWHPTFSHLLETKYVVKLLFHDFWAQLFIELCGP